MRDLFRMTSKALEIKMVKHHHYLKKKIINPGYLIHLFPVALFPMPGFGCCCYPISSQCHLQPYQADGHLHKSFFCLPWKMLKLRNPSWWKTALLILSSRTCLHSCFYHLRVVINFHVNYAPSQGIKSAVKNLNWALLQSTALTKKWHQSHELTTFLKAMHTVSFFGSFPTSTPQFAIKICCFRLWYWILSWKLQKWERMLPFRAETLLPLGFFWRRKMISFIEKHQ